MHGVHWMHVHMWTYFIEGDNAARRRRRQRRRRRRVVVGIAFILADGALLLVGCWFGVVRRASVTTVVRLESKLYGFCACGRASFPKHYTSAKRTRWCAFAIACSVFIMVITGSFVWCCVFCRIDTAALSAFVRVCEPACCPLSGPLERPTCASKRARACARHRPAKMGLWSRDSNGGSGDGDASIQSRRWQATSSERITFFFCASMRDFRESNVGFGKCVMSPMCRIVYDDA